MGDSCTGDNRSKVGAHNPDRVERSGVFSAVPEVSACDLGDLCEDALASPVSSRASDPLSRDAAICSPTHARVGHAHVFIRQNNILIAAATIRTTRRRRGKQKYKIIRLFSPPDIPV